MTGRSDHPRRGSVIVRDGVPYGDPSSTLSLLPAAAQGEWLFRHRDAFTGRALDLGCGNQPYRIWYETLVDQVVCFDPVATAGVHVVGLAESLPFADCVFDFILASEVLEHVDNAENACAEMFRVLRPGGEILVTVPFIYPVHEAPYDHRRFTQFGLIGILERKGFQSLDVMAKGGLGVLGAHWAMMTTIAGADSLAKKFGRRLLLNEVTWFRRFLIRAQESAIRRGIAVEVGGSSAWASLGYMIRARKPS